MKWIPMSERLPENGHYYLWCSDMGSVQSDYYWDGFEKEQKYGYNIVAWMPLPRPYTADRKTEPTISKMEQVDKDINVRSKDEPSDSEKPNNCETCKHHVGMCLISECNYEAEPQTSVWTSGVVWTEDAIKDEPKSYSTWASTIEPQTERSE